MPVLEKIVISDFRNIRLQEIEFSPNINCISGNNGEGKTNLIDSIYYMSMTKSAFASSDKYILRHGAEEFALAGTYAMENGTRSRFSMKMTSKGEKKVRRDDKPYPKVSDHVGALPVVMVSPSDISLVSDSGDERRRFVNSVLSQMDHEYMTALQQYNRLLLQRNRMLKEMNVDRTLLEVIDMRMSYLAGPIYEARRRFVDDLKPVVAEYYNISPNELSSKVRTSKIAMARHIAMYLCRTLLTSSLSQIGNEFGGRDHSTVIHSVDKIDKEIKTATKITCYEKDYQIK